MLQAHQNETSSDCPSPALGGLEPYQRRCSSKDDKQQRYDGRKNQDLMLNIEEPFVIQNDEDESFRSSDTSSQGEKGKENKMIQRRQPSLNNSGSHSASYQEIAKKQTHTKNTGNPKRKLKAKQQQNRKNNHSKNNESQNATNSTAPDARQYLRNQSPLSDDAPTPQPLLASAE